MRTKMKIHYHHQRNKSNDNNNNRNSNSNYSNNALIHNATFLLLFFLSLAQTSVLLVTLLPVVNAVSSSSSSSSLSAAAAGAGVAAAAGAGAGAGATSPKSFATMTKKKKKTSAFASIKKTTISNKKEKVSSTATATATTTATATSRGGGIIATGNKVNNRKETLSSSKSNNKPQQQVQPPSIYWAVLHNWLYFLSLGFNAINMPYLIREVIDGKDAISVQGYTPSSNAIALSGNVEAIDKVCTFCGIAFLSALSDKYGRKSLIVWSSFGFAITNLLQAFVASSSSLFFLSSGSGGGHGHGIRISLLYLADFIDGCSSCMTPVCQAYVADCSYGSGNLASNLGIFQGISIGGAFILAFPIGGLIGAKYGPTIPIICAAIFQLINCCIALFITPESNRNKSHLDKRITFAEVNPISGLQRLFGIGKKKLGTSGNNVNLLRTTSIIYLCISIARNALDAQFVNYSNIRFGWNQAQSGPCLVMVGLMLAVVPRILVPILGITKSINYGLLIYTIGLICASFASSSFYFILSIAIIAIGCVAIPAIQALLANLAPDGEAGALLGAVGSLNELTGAIGSSMYATLLATFATTTTTAAGTATGTALSNKYTSLQSMLLKYLPNIPGMHFLIGSIFCFIGWLISFYGLNNISNKNHPALLTKTR